MNDLKPAIIELDIALDTMKTNEPINRREGNVAQADLERDNAKSYKAAIGELKRKRRFFPDRQQKARLRGAVSR